MKNRSISGYRLAVVAAAAILAGAAFQSASASIIFQTGNHQYTNVNVVADAQASSLVGEIGNTGLTMTFQNMIGPDGMTQVDMHGQHGVAFVESYADSLSNVHTGFYSITLQPQAGYGFTGGDFALDELNGLLDGFVTLKGVDQFNHPTSQTFAIDANGQTPYNFYTTGGDLVTSLVISGTTLSTGGLVLMQDIKQVSLEEVLIPGPVPVPEPSSLLLMGIGLAGVSFSRRRKSI